MEKTSSRSKCSFPSQGSSQKDRHHLEIVWSDGLVSQYRLSHLQKNCPCAACHETPPQVDVDVSAVQVTMVGRYAFAFSLRMDALTASMSLNGSVS